MAKRFVVKASELEPSEAAVEKQTSGYQRKEQSGKRFTENRDLSERGAFFRGFRARSTKINEQAAGLWSRKTLGPRNRDAVSFIDSLCPA